MTSALAACSDGVAQPRSAVVITLDATRMDAIGVYGGDRSVTPNLDRLAASSLRYERARTVAPLTLPAHASMFTGLYPPRHGVRVNAPSMLPLGAITVAERARKAGLQTAAFVGSLELDNDLGLAQGFDEWSQPKRGPDDGPGVVPQRQARIVVNEAVNWLEQRDISRPFFLWVHLFDAHVPYAPPTRYRTGERSPYQGEIAALDAAVGELVGALDERGLLGESFLVVVADHGEGLGDHGEERHGLFCWDSTLRVPLLLRYRDGYGAGEVSQETVSVVDLAPTLLQAMELKVAPDLDGASLYYQSVPTDRGVYFESYEGWHRFGWSPLTGWADASGKYVHGARPSYFARADEAETDDLLARGEELPARYVDGIAGVAAKEALRKVNDRAPDEKVLAAMARLGYAPTMELPPPYPDPLEVVDRPDPRDQKEAFARFTRAREAEESGDHATAIALLESLVAENPYDVSALDVLATALIASGEHARAVGVLRTRLALAPEQIATHRDLKDCLTALGEDELARAHSARSMELLIEAHELRGQRQEASRYREMLQRIRAR